MSASSSTYYVKLKKQVFTFSPAPSPFMDQIISLFVADGTTVRKNSSYVAGPVQLFPNYGGVATAMTVSRVGAKKKKKKKHLNPLS